MAKKRRRAKSEGSPFRWNGRWRADISLGYDANGKRRRRSVYGSTEAEVVDKLHELRRQSRVSRRAVMSTETLGGFMQYWLDHIVVNRAETTKAEYASANKLSITPFIGSIKLRNLNVETLQRWLTVMRQKGFSANKIARAVRVLRNALNVATRESRIMVNPAAHIQKPRVVRKPICFLEVDQTEKLIKAAGEHRLAPMILVAVRTGMRLGELFALEWQDVKLSERVLVVRRTLVQVTGHRSVKEPKSEAGRRMLVLDGTTIEALKTRRQQAAEEGFPPETHPLVFPNTRGTWLTKNTFYQNFFHGLRDRAGLPNLTPHHLRHTHAAQLIAAGVGLKEIQARLGHSSFGITADTYGHLLTDVQTAAIDKLDQYISRQSRTTNRGTK